MVIPIIYKVIRAALTLILWNSLSMHRGYTSTPRASTTTMSMTMGFCPISTPAKSRTLSTA